MISVDISNELKSICPSVALGCIYADVEVQQYNSELWKEIEGLCTSIKENITLEEISNLPNLKESREVYRRLKKDPTRYRLSSEALLRRIVKGKGLYNINNIVDINNLTSIKSYYSVGCYDIDKLSSSITFTIGRKDQPYIGIGRGPINIENLPVLSDEIGPFGSATSDSERTKVTLETKRILMSIVSFNGTKDFPKYINLAKDAIEKFASGKNIKCFIAE